MSIIDVTEDQIFQTLGRGKDPNFKQIEKVRPAVPKPKKTYPINHIEQATQAVVEPEKSIPLLKIDESMKKFAEELCELSNRVSGIQTMVKWYILPQFVIILVLLLALFIKS